MMMTLSKRTYLLWLARTLAALLVAVALTAGAGSALAHDDDDDEVVTYGPNACTAVAELPTHPSAVCVKHKSEVDDGLTETTNSYVVQAPTTGDAVRLHFEAAFAQYGWTVVKAKRDVADQEWEYTVVKGQRRVKVEVEVQAPHRGGGTEIVIKEG